MLKFLKHHMYSGSVFITGASCLVVEIVATRVLSPFFGNTIFAVSSIISVILAALSLGYYVGGNLADKHPSQKLFFLIILASGLLSLVLHVLGMVFLPLLGYALSISIGPLVSSLLLFFPSAFLFGMLSPFAVKLQSVNYPEHGVGSVAGSIFFWSTLGSIAGSLLSGFVFIPLFGVNQIMICNSLILVILGLVPLYLLGDKKYHFLSVMILISLIASSIYVADVVKGDVLYSKDGIYEKISIYDGTFKGRPTRYFQQDRSSSGAMFLDSEDPKDLPFDYTKYYMLYKVFNPEISSALVIGGGAYSIPKALLDELPNANVDVSEIEPSLYELAQTYFDLTPGPRLHNYTTDGRRLLSDSKKNYDMIFSDVYYSLYSIPAHFTTQEFFLIAKKKLNKKGVFIANMIGDLSRQKPSLIMSEIKTFQSVFPNSYFFATESVESTASQNIMFVGYNSDEQIDFKSLAIGDSQNSLIRDLPNKLIDVSRFDLSPYPVLTDNYSPVEYLTGQVLRRAHNNNFFNGEEMLSLIDQQLRYGPRHPTGVGHTFTKDFLIADMTALVPSGVITQTWVHTEDSGKSYPLTNIIVQLYPTSTKRIILATHYDSLKTSFKDGEGKSSFPSPGANNSASGVAVLVRLAHLLKSADVPPGVGIDIVFFDGEEGDENSGADFTNWKPLGSTYFVQHLSELYGEYKPVAGVVLDMVCDSDLHIPKEASSVRDAPDVTEAFWKIAISRSGDVFEERVGPEIRDDHTSLNKAGIPSVLVIDYDYPYYATTHDVSEKCSAQSLEAVASAVWGYVYVGEK